MAGQKGFLYEAAIHTKLKNKGLVPLGFQPAAADPNKPDGKFIYNGQTYNLEVKLNFEETDFGQGTLDYTPNGWVLVVCRSLRKQVFHERVLQQQKR